MSYGMEKERLDQQFQKGLWWCPKEVSEGIVPFEGATDRQYTMEGGCTSKKFAIFS
jgi:hypothetical protein